MPTALHTLRENPEDHAMLHSLHRGTFLEGECYAFAIALNQGLGWPLAGLMHQGEIWHAGVRAPDGRMHDVRGFLTEEEFGGHFLSPPFIIREIASDELYATRPVHDLTIKRARQVAEALWPELPWRESRATRAKAFADELEALSRKHRLWVCGSVPADPPRLFDGYDDEGGYKVRPTIDGLAFTIHRYFPD